MSIESLLLSSNSSSKKLIHHTLVISESIVIAKSTIQSPRLALSKALTLALEKSCKLAKNTIANIGMYEDQNNDILKIFDSIATTSFLTQIFICHSQTHSISFYFVYRLELAVDR